MPRRIKPFLNDAELAELETAMRREPSPEVRQRATAIRLLHQGYKVDEVAQTLVVSVASVGNWLRRWRREGLGGLANKPKSGRPCKADEAYCRLLEETLQREPGELGFGFSIWTADRLRFYLAEQRGILVVSTAFRELLKERGYHYRRPKHDLHHLQDRQAKEQAREMLAELKKGDVTTKLSSSLWTKRP